MGRNRFLIRAKIGRSIYGVMRSHAFVVFANGASSEVTCVLKVDNSDTITVCKTRPAPKTVSLTIMAL